MKRSIKRLLFAGVLAVLACGCANDGFTIEGTIAGGGGKSLWLEELGPEGTIFIDSIPMDNTGHFEYSYTPPYHSMYNLHTTDNNFIVTLPSKGERLVINGNWENLSMNYTVEGSEESTLLWQLQQYSNEGSMTLRDLVDSLNQFTALLEAGSISQAEFDAHKSVTDHLYRELFIDQQEYVCHFIEENAGSLSTLIALYKPFNNHPLIMPTDTSNMKYFDMVLSGLEKELPNNPHTLHFKSVVNSIKSELERRMQNRK